MTRAHARSLVTLVERRLDWAGLLVLGALMAAIALTAIARDRTTPFVHDEVYTVVIAGLPTVGAIWAAELSGADLMPPLNSAATHFVQRVAGAGSVSSRLPPLTGYLVMTAAIFAIVRPRAGVVVALAAAALPFFTAAFAFASEARGYGLMIGLYAVAFYAWTKAAAGERRGLMLPLMAVSLGLGLWTHYYSIIGFVPIGAGEIWRLRERRRVDWSIAGALVTALFFLLPLLPLIRLASGHAGTYWRRARLSSVIPAYRELLGPLAIGRGLGLLAIAGAVVLAGLLLRRKSERLSHTDRPRLHGYEVVAGLALMAAPIWAVLFGLVATGIFVPRYALIGVVGLGLGFPLLVSRFGPANRVGDVVFCAALLASVAQLSYRAVLGEAMRPRTVFDGRPLLVAELAGREPVAVAGPLYLETWYDASADQRARLMYLADPAVSLQVAGSDTLDRGYLALRRWAPITVEDYRSYVTRQPRFDAYIEGEFGWLPAALRRDGIPLREIGREGQASLFAVGPS